MDKADFSNLHNEQKRDQRRTCRKYIGRTHGIRGKVYAAFAKRLDFVPHEIYNEIKGGNI